MYIRLLRNEGQIFVWGMANQLLLIAIGILWFFLLVCGVYMITTRHVHQDRSRIFFALFALVSSLTLLLKMYFMLRETDIQNYFHILPLRELVFGQFCRYLFALYPLEIARPHWLTLRRWLGFGLPWILTMTCYGLFLGFHQTQLHSFQDLLINLDKPDVVMRLVLLLFMFPVEFIWALSYDSHQSSAGRSWLRKMTIMVSLIALAFVGNTLTRHVAWRSFHAFIYMCYILYVMYIELFVRIPVPMHQAQGTLPEMKEPIVLPPAPAAKNEADNPLLQQIRQLMEVQELWREPELMLDDLVQRLGSNRTYVTQCIHQMGYNGFKEYLNRLRVEYIRRQLLQPQHERLQSLFYEAGYRSRGSAWRNFTSIVGCSPSEYEERSRQI